MNIRGLCYRGVLPVFFVLGLAAGALVFFVENRETDWSLAEEARGVSVAVSEFVSGSDFLNLSAGDMQTDIIMPVRRITDAGRALRISAIDGPAGGKVIFDEGVYAGRPLPGDGIISVCFKEMKTETAFLDGVDGGSQSVLACSPLKDAAGNAVGVLLVETDASMRAVNRARTVRTAVTGMIISFATGVLCALVIAVVLKRNLNNFAASVQDMSPENMTSHNAPGVISEIHDLWNTFLTADSVLRDAELRTRRELMDVEMFRTEEDLADAYTGGGRKCEALDSERAGIRLLLSGHNPAGAVYLTLQAESALYAVTGMIESGSGALKDAVAASAAVSFLMRQLPASGFEEAVKKAAALFGIRDLAAVRCDRVAGDLVVARSGEENGSVVFENKDLSTGAVLVHVMDKPVARAMDIYKDTYPDDSVDEMGQKLLTIVRQYAVNEGASFVIVKQK